MRIVESRVGGGSDNLQEKSSRHLEMQGGFREILHQRGTVDFNEVQIVPSRHGNAESREAIRTTGLEACWLSRKGAMIGSYGQLGPWWFGFISV